MLDLSTGLAAKVEKVPGAAGKEDEINIGMEVVVDPDDPNQKPMTTFVEAQVSLMSENFEISDPLEGGGGRHGRGGGGVHQVQG